MIDDPCNGLRTDISLADLVVAILMGAAGIFGVVQMDRVQTVYADHPVKFRNHAVCVLFQRIACIGNVACIKAHTDVRLKFRLHQI